MFKILVLNLGATSSKASVFEDETLIDEMIIRHSEEEMEAAPLNKDQIDLRMNLIKELLESKGLTIDDFNAVAMRGGGMTKATTSGTYLVNDAMRRDVYNLFDPEGPFVHGARLVLPILDLILDGRDIPIFVTDPPYVDECSELGKITGNALFTNKPSFHALNHKAIGRKAAAKLGKPYEELNLVIAHMGGGVSVVAHQKGRMIDSKDCTAGTGAMSPERSGSIPANQLLDLCFSGKYTEQELRKIIRGNGGVYSYLGTKDMREVEEMAKTDEKADLIFRAFAYQVGREIGASCAALYGDVDAIILTGGIAHSERMRGLIADMVVKFAPVLNYAGEAEAEALVAGALRVLRNEEDVVQYS